MNYCKKCVMPDTRPGIKFNENGICYPCLVAEKKKQIDWKKRQEDFQKICDKYKSKNGHYDCVIPVSGGKDSHFQTYILKEIYKMNPLLVCVSDSFTHTIAGQHNLRNISEVFGCDIFTFNLNHLTVRKMVRLAFENFGSPTWCIDMAIYSVPLKVAAAFNIPLVVYGENIAYEYGGPEAEETYSAKDQIKNDVVKAIDWEWWSNKGVSEKEIAFIKYPSFEIVDKLEPIYLSYFYPWDGYQNYQLAKKYGFKSLNDTGEWKREGFIEDYDQIDSMAYLVHPWFKYPKFGHARATDVSCYWIRAGKIKREEAIKLVKEHDHKLDPKALKDFLDFTGYTEKEFWAIAEKFWNKDIFEKSGNKWIFKNPIWEQK